MKNDARGAVGAVGAGIKIADDELLNALTEHFAVLLWVDDLFGDERGEYVRVDPAALARAIRNGRALGYRFGYVATLRNNAIWFNPKD